MNFHNSSYKFLNLDWIYIARQVKNISELIDSSVMPGIQGGPLMHVIAGKAIAFKEALSSQKLNPGQRIMLVGFGVGYSWASNLVHWFHNE